MKSDSKFNMYKLQEQIKNNNIDVHSYVSELSEWTNEMNQKDKKIPAANKQTQPTTKQSQLPPIRNRIDISESIKQAQKTEIQKKGDQPIVPELEKFKRDNSAMPEYYKAWDKFAKKIDSDEDEANEAATNP